MSKFLSKLLWLIDDAMTAAEALYYKAGCNVAKSLQTSNEKKTQLDFFKLTRENYKYWEVIDELDWKNVCLKYTKPWEVIKFKLIKLFDMEEEMDTLLIAKLFEETRARVNCLKSTLEEYALDQSGSRFGLYKISDDSFHYLCTHIVGCGKEAYEEAMNHPEVVIPKYIENNNYHEGFEYGFITEDD